MKIESEFGRGLVVNLVKFAEHFMNRMDPNSELTKTIDISESYKIGLWANGASDHLYEIMVPRRWKGTLIEMKVKELQDLGLEIGHGFSGRTWTNKDYNRLWELTLEIAVLIDSSIGLKRQVDVGKW